MLKKIIIYNILITIFLLFIALEFIYPTIIPTPHLVYRFWGDKPVTYYPNKKMRAVTKNYDQTFITNSNGYNDFEINGKIDILIIGDSYVEAIEINQKNHFSEVIKQKLNNIKVNKMGMSGYGNSHYLSTYLVNEAKYDPDIIIIVNVFNDLKDNFCDLNTSSCSSAKIISEIQNIEELNKEIKFLQISQGEYKFNYGIMN